MADETLDLLDTRATLRPDGRETFGDQALSELRALGDRSGGLVLGDTLGKGGMGLVRVGEQRSVGRPVAIKTLKPGVGGDHSALSLLREGWVTGRLEHPNVVPVYDVGTDAAGQPFLVLKRIDGEVWTTLLRHPERVREDHGATDVVEWHLRVLLAVTDAVRFAHDRGVIHRDLKPDNVMIGRFGEVYLLDWGIAAALVPDPTGRLPRQPGLCGSPAYMAPEMFASAEPSVAMDIYLLGGLLHEVLFGEPPHRAKDLEEAKAASLRPLSRPHQDEPELAALCGRALSPDPSERPATADGFRDDLQAGLDHRDSHRLARRAESSHAGMATETDAGQRRRLFTEARFGWQQALELWPENEVAKRALHESIAKMVRWELAQGAVRAAAALAEEHADLPARLHDEVSKALAEQAKEAAELEAMRRDQDDSVGQRTRVFLSLVFGASFVVFPLVSWRYQDAYSDYSPALIGATWAVIVLAMTAGLVVWARDSLSKTSVNRSFARLMLIVPISQLFISLSALATNDSMEEILRTHFVVWAALSAGASAALDSRFFISAFAFFAVWVLSAQHPGYGLPLMAAADFVFAVNLLWMWVPGTTLPRSWIERLGHGG